MGHRDPRTTRGQVGLWAVLLRAADLGPELSDSVPPPFNTLGIFIFSPAVISLPASVSLSERRNVTNSRLRLSESRGAEECLLLGRLFVHPHMQ